MSYFVQVQVMVTEVNGTTHSLTTLGSFIMCSQSEVLENLRAESFLVHVSHMHNDGNSPHHQRENAISPYLQTAMLAA